MKALFDGDIAVYRIGFATQDKPFSICAARLDSYLKNAMEESGCTDYQGFLTDGHNNYRNKIAVTVPYKGLRTGIRPLFYYECREYLVNEWGFTIEYDQEADDALGIAQTEDTCIITIDKDLDNVPGFHYNPVRKDRYNLSNAEAYRNFYCQILTGDRIDNVLGLPNIGPVRARKLLADADTNSAMWKVCVDKLGYDRAKENGQLLWIRWEPNEIWEPPCL